LEKKCDYGLEPSLVVRQPLAGGVWLSCRAACRPLSDPVGQLSTNVAVSTNCAVIQ